MENSIGVYYLNCTPKISKTECKLINVLRLGYMYKCCQYTVVYTSVSVGASTLSSTTGWLSLLLLYIIYIYTQEPPNMISKFNIRLGMGSQKYIQKQPFVSRECYKTYIYIVWNNQSIGIVTLGHGIFIILRG